ncbi:ATPase [Sulfobacillus thermosulfidooxidans]|uniref:calcium-transporting P-type ATPase, PMR1-type n=1 Tax=Sulfobacillus thermosulfidooxidans TaxID=28034 RepID=UPI00096BA93E|nr:calcium-transporting P-type ATPase, PMR1-type [Sulfobacillus thermosulfidooxidans]OLZ09745.1 ATPase [Sulfobacillus thermosulfidooxidans]OLZ15948.1 ATPase [Sulfobacillus thermosulfidooxidans]OLZ18204.1 ATPase [Sulfobacillus thermosulfidooxidans]
MGVAEIWHTLTSDEAIIQLRSDSHRGLSTSEAESRLQEIGLNAIQEADKTPWWSIFFSQFQDFMVLVLIGATVVSFLLGEVGDAITIVAIVVMNAILGFVQEYRAEKSVETLKALTAPEARVVRGGQVDMLPAEELVPGDIIELEAGDRIPADCRLIEVHGLQTDEAPLTGESQSVSKTTEPLSRPDIPVADRRNMVYMGTTVARGRAKALVVETGMHTEMGNIANLMREAVEDQTPLQRRLEHLGKILVYLSLLIVMVVVVTGLFRGEPLYQMFLTGVSLAVAAIPEGLPAIVTIALALGVQRMIKAHAIVRRLPAVETLGCTTVICTDKTGTLTKNQMTVTQIWVDNDFIDTTDESRTSPTLPKLYTAAALCNNASVDEKDPDNPDKAKGDPTEIALLWAANHGGIDLSEVASEYLRKGEIPFESERQRMAVLTVDRHNRYTVFVKGAPDVLLGFCRYLEIDGRLVLLDNEWRQRIRSINDDMAARALRVLGVAYRSTTGEEPQDHWERDLILLGLVGMMDPPRPEAVQAVKDAKRAGLRTVMITGDHPKTARAIGEAMGMVAGADEIITGPELDTLTDTDLAQRVENIRIYARVSPPHKLRVVRAWKAHGEVVAMTGDGVNDAPALKEADIGVAMGKTGTDVTKEASAMILTDDNFATIVRAIEEGRAIYDNIRKFIRYLLSCNVGEVLVMFLAAFLGLPLPLLPIQILFVNLVTDGLPAMALGVDPPSPGVMDRPPRDPNESIFARGLGTKIAFRGLLIGVSTLLVFIWSLQLWGMGLREARTMALATLIMSQLFHVFDARAEDRSFLEIGLFSNIWAVLAVLSSVMMLLAIIYVPSLRELFKTDPLGLLDWGIVVLASGFIQLLAAVRDVVLRPIRHFVHGSVQ